MTGEDPRASVPELRTKTEALVDFLREEIRSGALAPGARLRQVEIAERFRVSTTPVREAFTALEREGLLVSSSHRGVVVFCPSVDDLHQIYEVRIPLEALAAEKAAERITDEDLAELEQLLGEMARSTADTRRYPELNRAFHARIYSIAQRPKLESLIADLRDSSAAYLRVYATAAPTAHDTQLQHEQIFEALKARDPKRAADAVARHLQYSVKFVSAGLGTLDGVEPPVGG